MIGSRERIDILKHSHYKNNTNINNMVLETCIICLDTSEYLRNGDYIPNRLVCMCDAATLVSDAKLGQNPESSVGILQMSDGIEVLASPTTDMSKILAVCADLKIRGKLSLDQGLSVAALALKHRKNKNGDQRIIAFVASPLDSSEGSTKKLIKIAKQLKKNGIAVDIVCMGETEQNQQILTQFIEAVSKDSNSHLVTVPEGILPSDVLISSPIVYGNEGGAGGAGGGGAFAEYGGMDPNLDPELALALRASMEEERARQQEQSAKTADSGNATATTSATAAGDDDDVIQQALLMSMATDSKAEESAQKAASSANEEDEDEILAKALMMSQQEEASNKESEQQQAAIITSTNAPSTSSQAATNTLFSDPSFVSQLLADFPGVDMNSPEILSALEAVKSGSTTSSVDASQKKESDKDDKDEKDAKKQKKNDDDDKNT